MRVQNGSRRTNQDSTAGLHKRGGGHSARLEHDHMLDLEGRVELDLVSRKKGETELW